MDGQISYLQAVMIRNNKQNVTDLNGRRALPANFRFERNLLLLACRTNVLRDAH